MEVMYKAIPFSPVTTLTESIGDGDTVIPVANVGAFPEAPNIAVIGGVNEESETILYAAKTSNALSGCTRGVEGTAKSWNKGETISRNYTAKDHDSFVENIKELFNKAIKSAQINEAGNLVLTLQDNSTLDAGNAKGDKGDKGETGAKGDKGDKGETGATGEPGPAGQDGADGAAATITVGTVTTGEPGTQAQVVNAGTANAAKFNFVIPKGETGAKGDKGDTGSSGTNGSDGADATINGVNALTLTVAGNLSGSQSGDTYTISGANLLPKSGGSMTGDITMGSHKLNGTLSGTDYTTYRARGIALVTSAPSSLSNGCVAIVYS